MPYINRFLQPDTIVPSYTNPQHLNRFSYVLNSPLRYTDPTGHSEYEGNDGRLGSNCQKYGQYCSNGKPKSKEELKKMRNDGLLCRNCHDVSTPQTTREFEFNYTNYDPTQDWYLAGYDYTINWSQVDWYHLITNGAGIVSDVAARAVVLGLIPAAPVAEFTFAVDAIGVTTDVFDFVENNDFSGIGLDVAGYALKETKAVRIIPGIGFTSNIDGFMDALHKGSTATPIWIRKP